MGYAVQRDEKHIKTIGEDAMFNHISLSENQKNLASNEKRLAKLLKDNEKKKINLEFKDLYDQMDTGFDEIKQLLNSQWNEMDLMTQAVCQSDLLKLLEFYSELLK